MDNSQLSSVIITGASSGIGRELALEMARRGYALGLTARRMSLLETLREEIWAANGKEFPVELAALDVCQTDSVGPVIRELFTRLGSVRIVVVNAGANDMTDIGQYSLDKELNLIHTNLCGAIATVDAAVACFGKRDGGHIVGISSLASLQPIARQAAYCASKAGFSMYLNAARIELRQKRIRVTNILPGYVATDIVHGVDIGTLPFAIAAHRAAREISSLIEKQVKTGIVPAFPWKLIRPFLGHLPERLARY